MRQNLKRDINLVITNFIKLVFLIRNVPNAHGPQIDR